MPQSTRKFKCSSCSYEIESPYGIPKPQACPKCGAPAQFIHRVDTGPRRADYSKRRGKGSRDYTGPGKGAGGYGRGRRANGYGRGGKR